MFAVSQYSFCSVTIAFAYGDRDLLGLPLFRCLQFEPELIWDWHSECLHRFASRLGLIHGFPQRSYGTARVLAKALCLDDGERPQVEMSNVRRTTNVHSVAAGAQSAGLVYAARRLPTLRVPIWAWAWIFPAFDLRDQLWRRGNTRPRYLSGAGFLGAVAHLGSSDPDDSSNTGFQPLVCSSFEGPVPRVRPLFRSAPGRGWWRRPTCQASLPITKVPRSWAGSQTLTRTISRTGR